MPSTCRVQAQRQHTNPSANFCKSRKQTNTGNNSKICKWSKFCKLLNSWNQPWLCFIVLLSFPSTSSFAQSGVCIWQQQQRCSYCKKYSERNEVDNIVSAEVFPKYVCSFSNVTGTSSCTSGPLSHLCPQQRNIVLSCMDHNFNPLLGACLGFMSGYTQQHKLHIWTLC